MEVLAVVSCGGTSLYRRLAALLLVFLAEALVFHLAPQAVMICIAGTLESWEAAPGPIGIFTLRNSLVQRIGATRFALRSAYQNSSASLSSLAQHAYFAEGYLFLRSVIPRDTVLALRHELLQTLGTVDEPYAINAWMNSEALLDFFCFGPLGGIAAQLLGTRDVHLINGWHHFRGGGLAGCVRAYHYDMVECEAGFLPAHDTLRTGVKFFVALYDAMPGMWFFNQSTVEKWISFTYGAEQLKSFRAGHWGPLDDGLNIGVRGEPIRPILQLGDVIAHSPCLVHRSPPTNGGRPTGFVGPTYAAPTSSHRGINHFARGRRCDSGSEWGAQITRVSWPDCFPQVREPLSEAQAAALRLRVNGGPSLSPKALLKQYLAHQHRALRLVVRSADRSSYSPVLPGTEIPASNEMSF